jgi:hypothetical protein
MAAAAHGVEAVMALALSELMMGSKITETDNDNRDWKS